MNVSVLLAYRSDGGHRDRLWEWNEKRWRGIFPSYEIVLGEDDSEVFSRSKARNNAASKASGDIFIIADTDTTCSTNQIIECLRRTTENTWTMPYQIYYNLSQESTESLLIKDPLAPMPKEKDFTYEHRVESSPAGILIMSREIFESVGGYDERFNGWGFEDNAFFNTVKEHFGPPLRYPGYCLHMWHPIAPGTTFDSPTILHNRDLYYNEYVINRPKLKGTK